MSPKSAFRNSSSPAPWLVRLGCWLSVVLVALQAATGWAANGTWNTPFGASWTSVNWVGGVVADGTGFTADFGTLDIAANRTLTLDGARTIGNLTFGDTTATFFNWTLNTGTGGPLTLAVSSGSPTITVNNSPATAVNVVLAGSGGFTKANTAFTLTLGGVNTITGPVSVLGGSLQLGAGTVGTLSSASSITVANNAQLIYTAATAVTNSAPLTLTGTAAVAGKVIVNLGALAINGAGPLHQNGDITLAGATAGTEVRIGGYNGTAAFTLNLNGIISGTGTLGLRAQGIGGQVGNGQFFLNTNCTYNGNTTVEAFSANNLTTLGVDNALPPTTVLTQTITGATTNFSQLVLNGHSQILAGIASSSSTNNNRIAGGNATLSTLTVSNGAVATYIGVLGGPNANDNNLALVKAGTSTLTLTGTNTYSGGTTINAGTLIVTNNGTLGNTSGALTVSGGTLDLGVTSQTAGAVTITNGATIANGTLTGSSCAAKGGTISAVLAGSGTLTQSSNTLTLSGVNTLTGPVLINGGSLTPGGGTTGTLSSASSITVTNNAQLIYSTTAAVTNAAPLTLTGVGAGGKVAVNLGALAVLGAGGGNLYQNGAVTLAPLVAGDDVRIGGYGTTSTLNLNGVISGPGSLSLRAQGNPGTYNGQFFLNTNFTYTGGTTLDAYVANNLTTLGVDNALPPTTVLTQLNTALTTNYTQLVLNGHNQTLAGIVCTANTNTLATNRITGGSGTLSILTVSNGAAYTYSGILGGPNANDNNLALVKAGTNTLTLSGTNTYAGATTISNGTLLLNGSLAGGAVQVNGGALGGSGLINGAVTVASGGTLQPGLGGTDTSALTVNNTVSLAGTTLIAINRTNAQNAGKLVVASTLTLGGTLTVTNVGDAPQANDTFTLFTLGAAPSGSFSATNLPTLGAGLNWWQTVVSGNVAILVNAAPTNSAIAMGALSGTPATVQIIGGKHAPTGDAGEILTVTAVGVPGSGTATTDGTNITYTS
ncbi:MAG: autotransporter-associated beta strand repeat-containing protein, partial [Verrucomicrobia bacterium]|nr:autotransporter-associated beta strand repeat-containing protein [Verrucomicrobiota bacterium]